MQEIGSFEAKNKLSALLDQVEHGAEIVITRQNQRVSPFPIFSLCPTLCPTKNELPELLVGRINKARLGHTVIPITDNDMVKKSGFNTGQGQTDNPGHLLVLSGRVR